MRIDGEATASRARDALDAARRADRAGAHDDARRAVRDAAGLARALGDGELLAEAAILVGEPGMDWRSAPAGQALCLEALAMLGIEADGEPGSRRTWRERVRTRLDGLSTGWAGRVAATSERIAADEADRRFEAMQTAQRRAVGAHGLARRIDLADEAIRLGHAAGDEHIQAWGWHWRADALAHLGLRADLNRAVVELFAAAERTDSTIWAWRVATIRTTLALLEDRLEDVPALADAAREAGRRCAAPDAALCDLTLRGALAQRTGLGLEAVEQDVRAFVADGPLFAQAWRADLLLSMGRTAEAVAIERMLAPLVDDIPDDIHEWLVLPTALGILSMAADDRPTVERIRRRLTPYAHLHGASPITTPYEGPVALTLARLCTHLGDVEAARHHATDAAARADAMNAPWFAAQARRFRHDAPVAPAGPLSARESEVAGRIASGGTNREIAAALHLSERTVEQHVRSILRKLMLPNRSAVAAWVAARRREDRGA